jgi:hypothetical protein
MVRRPAPGSAGCTADAKTAFRCHGFATSSPGNVVSKTPSNEWQLKPKIGIIFGTTHPTRFSEKAAQWLANIASSAAMPNSRSSPENLVWWANVLKAGRQPETHPIAVRV